jgi:hypothetical protein
MTKKHFNALAEALRTIPDESIRGVAARAVASACQQFNPRFDLTRFLKLCGVGNVSD